MFCPLRAHSAAACTGSHSSLSSFFHSEHLTRGSSSCFSSPSSAASSLSGQKDPALPPPPRAACGGRKLLLPLSLSLSLSLSPSLPPPPQGRTDLKIIPSLGPICYLNPQPSTLNPKPGTRNPALNVTGLLGLRFVALLGFLHLLYLRVRLGPGKRSTAYPGLGQQGCGSRGRCRIQGLCRWEGGFRV